MIRKTIPALLCVLFFTLPLAAADDGGKWELLIQQEGITVHRRVIPNSSLVEFRGRGAVNATLLEILAVLADTDKYPDWVERNIGTKILQKMSETEMVYYSSTKAPFPFQDRDFVAKFRFIADEKTGWIHLKASETTHAGAPPRGDRVRMPFIRVRWSLKPLEEKKVWMEFRVHADPGGNIPDWVTNLVSKKIPFNSIRNLRARIKDGKVDKKFIEQYKQWDGWGLKKPEGKPK